MLVEVKYTYETKPSNPKMNVTMRHRKPDGSYSEEKSIIDTPNDSWKGSNMFNVDDKISASDLASRVRAYLINTQNAVPSSVVVKKMTRMNVVTL